MLSFSKSCASCGAGARGRRQVARGRGRVGRRRQTRKRPPARQVGAVVELSEVADGRLRAVLDRGEEEVLVADLQGGRGEAQKARASRPRSASGGERPDRSHGRGAARSARGGRLGLRGSGRGRRAAPRPPKARLEDDPLPLPGQPLPFRQEGELALLGRQGPGRARRPASRAGRGYRFLRDYAGSRARSASARAREVRSGCEEWVRCENAQEECIRITPVRRRVVHGLKRPVQDGVEDDECLVQIPDDYAPPGTR